MGFPLVLEKVGDLPGKSGKSLCEGNEAVVFTYSIYIKLVLHETFIGSITCENRFIYCFFLSFFVVTGTK